MHSVLRYLSVAVLWLASPVVAATYYVDYVGGADGNAGDAVTAAFQHSPGDPAAKGKAAAVQLQPGDTVEFKGGVIYRGSIVMQQSGSEGKPITFDGNTAGAFGTGRAIVDGSEPLTGWKKCASADECDGNPNWEKIWWTEVPFPIADPSVNLYENQAPLDLAEDPKPQNTFTPELSEYSSFDANKVTSTTLQDEKHLVQAQANAWDGALVTVYVPSGMYFRKVTGFDPLTHTITFKEFAEIPGAKKYAKYAMLNALVILNHPGQYVVRGDDKKAKVFLWPMKSGAAPEGVTLSRRACGFDLNGQSYVTIEGFVIQKFVAAGGHSAAAIADAENKANGGLIIRNNLVTACSRAVLSTLHVNLITLTGQKGALVEKNQIYDNFGSGAIKVCGAGHVVKDNIIRRYASMGIIVGWGAQGTKDCQVVGNTLEEGRGDKLIGILVFKCGAEAHIRVLGNRVTKGGDAMNIAFSTGVTVACNVLQAPPGRTLIHDYGDAKDIRLLHNVAIDENAKAFTGGSAYAEMKNNIFVGNGAKLDPGAGFRLDDAHNLSTDLAHLSTLFVDPAQHDYRLKKGSPAIGAGVPTEIKQDAAGTPFPEGKTPDVGAFVYTD